MAPQPSRQAGGLNETAGTIEVISVVNFMCHESLRVEFNPNVNVVVGENGSGKSALLTAIMLCLGGKPRATSRALNIGSLVQEGKTKSILSVTLRNTLPDAYRHDAYGDRITVERTITLNPQDRKKASSVFVLKGENGKIVDRGLETVQDLLDRFGINTENPINVMTQEMSKEFLGSADPKKSYQLFAEASLIALIEHELQVSEMKTATMHDNAMEAEKDLKAKEKECAKASGLVAKFDNLDQLQDELETQMVERVWANVMLEEARAEQALREVAKLESGSIPKTEVQIQKNQERVRECVEHLEAVQRKFDECNRHAEEHNRRIKEAALAVKVAEQGLARPKATLDRIARTRAKGQLHVQSLQTQASQVQETATQATQAVRQQRDQEIAAAEEDVRRTKEEVVKWEQAMAEAQAQLDDANRQLAENDDAKARAQRELQALQRDLNNLSSQQKNKDAAFGGEFGLALQRAIEQHNGFYRKPIGPIGKYLTLKDARWAMAVESCAGRQFDAFLVNDWNDHRVLMNLVREQQRNTRGGYRAPSIIVYPFDRERHRMPPERLPSAEFVTVYKVLDCDHDVVINALIDHAAIERVVLAKDLDEARRVAWDSRRYPNVKEAYLEDGEKLYSRGGIGAAAGNMAQRARLGVNIEHQLAAVTTEVEAAKQRVAAASRLRGGAEAQHKKATADLRAAQASLRTARQSQKRAEDTLLRARHMPVEDELVGGGGEADTALLEEEIAQLNQKLAALDGEEAEARRLMDVEQERLAAAQARLNELRADAGVVHQEEAEIDRKTAEWNGEKQKADKAVDHYVRLLAGYKGQLTTARAMLAQQEAVVQNALRSAKAMSEENPFTNRSPITNIEHFVDAKRRKVESLKKQIQQEESRVCGDETREQLVERAEMLKAQYNEAKAKFDEVMAQYDLLWEGLQLRIKRLHMKATGLATQVSHGFNATMNTRGFAGKINVDWTEKKLEINVNTGKDKGLTNSTKTLSGGEKSFTTLAFLLALAKENDCPFRCMDEFDIFMDSVTRKKSLETLITYAMENPHIQFVFLTPNEISEIEVGERVKVQRMKRPRDSSGRRLTSARPEAELAKRSLNVIVKNFEIEEVPASDASTSLNAAEPLQQNGLRTLCLCIAAPYYLSVTPAWFFDIPDGAPEQQALDLTAYNTTDLIRHCHRTQAQWALTREVVGAFSADVNMGWASGLGRGNGVGYRTFSRALCRLGWVWIPVTVLTAPSIPIRGAGDLLVTQTTPRILFAQSRAYRIYNDSVPEEGQFSRGQYIHNRFPSPESLSDKGRMYTTLVNYTRGQGDPRCHASIREVVPTTFRLYNATECRSFFRTVQDQLGDACGSSDMPLVDGCAFHDPSTEPWWVIKVTSTGMGAGIDLIVPSKHMRDGDLPPGLSTYGRGGSRCHLAVRDDTEPYDYFKPMQIAQAYQRNPLLLHGYKFNVRSYVLVLNMPPFMAFFHRGPVELARNKYRRGDDGDKAGHISSLYVPKPDDPAESKPAAGGGAEKGKAKGEEKGKAGIIVHWSMDRLGEEIVAAGAGVPGYINDTLIPDMKRTIVYALRAYQVAAAEAIKAETSGAFRLITFDFLIDEDLHMWLMEVNENPAIGPTANPEVFTSTAHLLAAFATKASKGDTSWPDLPPGSDVLGTLEPLIWADDRWQFGMPEGCV
eukprot:jgi/Mesvir1/13847/Mv15993-RA.1